MKIYSSLVEYTNLTVLTEAKAILAREEESLRKDLGNAFRILKRVT